MYLAIDIGGTKTLVAVFDHTGTAVEKIRFPTGDSYDNLLKALQDNCTELEQKHGKIKAIGAAIPVPINYRTGYAKLGHKFGWEESRFSEDLERVFSVPVVVENDANLAALSEAVMGAGQNHELVLYITISTGIGTGVIDNGEIDPFFAPVEGGFMYLNHDGQSQIWESFASGKAFTEKYGKMGAEVEDPAIWEEYSETLAAGFLNLIVVVDPDIIVVGGGMGAHYKKYEKFLLEKLDALRKPLQTVPIPKIVVAQLPEEAVVNGCYLIAKKTFDDRQS